MNQHLLKYSNNIQEEYIREHPYIMDAKVNKIFPNQMKIQIIEREPFAILPFQGNFLLVDTYGVVLEISNSFISGEYPFFAEIPIEDYHLGKAIKVEGDFLEKFFLTYIAVENTSISDDITYIYYDDGNFVFETSRNIDIILNDRINIAKMVTLVDEVYNKNHKQNFSIIGKQEEYIYTTNQRYQDLTDEELEKIEEESNLN